MKSYRVEAAPESKPGALAWWVLDSASLPVSHKIYSTQREAQVEVEELNEADFYKRNADRIAVVAAGYAAGWEVREADYSISGIVSAAADIVREIERRGEVGE